jgi:hypothetical protein
MLVTDKQTESRILEFNKFAQFMCRKFGVTVVLDGRKAHTDGRTITLPNLAGMSADDVDFLYCVLLHEIAHILKTEFTKESLAMIKSENHFRIANALEDARAENAMMLDYDGANDIFEKLYNKYTGNNKFMKRVFGIKNKKIGDFQSLCLYLHNRTTKIKNNWNFEAVVGAGQDKRVRKFVDKHGIDAILAESQLNSWTDSIVLAGRIYDMFFVKRKDSSEKINMFDVEQAVDKALKETLGDIAEKQAQRMEEISQRSEEIELRLKEVENAETKKDRDDARADASASKLHAQKEGIEERLELETQLTDLAEEKAKITEKLNKKALAIEKTRALIAKQDSSSTEEAAVERLKKLNERLARQEGLAERYRSRTSSCVDDENAAHEELRKIDAKYPSIKSYTEDEAKLAIDELDNQLQTIKQEKIDRAADLNYMIDDVESLKADLRSQKDVLRRAVGSQLKQMQDDLDSAGVPVSIVPAFDHTPGWSEADDVQQSFDTMATQQCGDIVTNGAGFSRMQNRDIMAVIAKAKTDLIAVDVVDIFRQKTNSSKLDEFNQSAVMKNTTTVADGASLESNRIHIPVTTEFDVVKMDTANSGTELTKIREEHSSVIRTLKSIFAFKFKAKKKIKFRGNQEEGGLDQRNLYKLATMTDMNFYELPNPKFVNEVTASIAVDISGSMDKSNTQYGRRLTETSLFLSDALAGCHINHEVVGYHAPVNHEMRNLPKAASYNRGSNSLETIVYRKFSDRGSAGLQNLKVHCTDNSDGESLGLVADRLLKQRSKRHVLFVITDGKPFLSDSDPAVLDQHLKDMIVQLGKKRVEVYAIGFNCQPEQYYGEKYCKIDQYSDLVQFCRTRLR